MTEAQTETKTITRTAAAGATHNRIAGLEADLLPIGKQLRPTHPLTTEQKRKLLEQVLETANAERRERHRQAAEEAVRGRDDVKAMLSLDDAFRNLSAGSPLVAVGGPDPVAAVQRVLDQYDGKFANYQIGVLTPLDPLGAGRRPLDDLAALAATMARKGVMLHVIGSVRPGTAAELADRCINKPVLSESEGYDAIQLFCQEVCRKDGDRNTVTAHSIVGAAVGKRVALDKAVAVAEPMAGWRDNDGQGVKGKLDCGELVQKFTDDERNQTLAPLGLNTATDSGGEVVVVTNRSCVDGDGIYTYATVVRLRQHVQAAFHRTCARYIWHSGKRDERSLEKALTAMTKFLKRLTAEGWLLSGRVKLDRKAMKLFLLEVMLNPQRPVDQVQLRYVNEEF